MNRQRLFNKQTVTFTTTGTQTLWVDYRQSNPALLTQILASIKQLYTGHTWSANMYGHMEQGDTSTGMFSASLGAKTANGIWAGTTAYPWFRIDITVTVKGANACVFEVITY